MIELNKRYEYDINENLCKLCRLYDLQKNTCEGIIKSLRENRYLFFTNNDKEDFKRLLEQYGDLVFKYNVLVSLFKMKFKYYKELDKVNYWCIIDYDHNKFIIQTKSSPDSSDMEPAMEEINSIPVNGNYLDGSDFKEWHDLMQILIDNEQTMNKTYKPGKKEKNITFVVTERCNLACTYCYEKCKTKKRMSKEVAKDAIDFLFSKKVNGYYSIEDSPVLTLEFIGGEPLLEIDLIDYITEYFKYKAFKENSPWMMNYFISITSNGVLYETEKVQDYVRRNKGNLSLSITIDGNKKLHDKCRVFPDGSGSYDIVESAVKLWLTQTVTSKQTKMTLCPQNIEYTFEAARDLWNLGMNGIMCNCVYEKGWEIKDAKVFYNQLKLLADYLLEDERYRKFYISLFDNSIGGKLKNKDNWCGGNGDMLAIGTDGKCYPCIRFMKYSLSNPEREEKCIGNIYDGIKKQNPWLLKLQKIDMINQCQHKDNMKCLKCKVASGCSLCTAYNYDYYGDPAHKATFICDMHKARVLANVYYWNKLYRIINVGDRFKLNLDKEDALQIIDENEYNLLINLSKEE